MEITDAMRRLRIPANRVFHWHWTVHATLAVALATGAGALRWAAVSFSERRFVRAIEEAGGAVHREAPLLPLRPFPIRGRPVAVEIASGSHPIPAELAQFATMRSVKSLSLNTSQVTDTLIPLLATFRHLERLDLTGTSFFFSSEGVKTLLEALPGLEELHVDAGLLSDEEIRSVPGASKLRLIDSVFNGP